MNESVEDIDFAGYEGKNSYFPAENAIMKAFVWRRRFQGIIAALIFGGFYSCTHAQGTGTPAGMTTALVKLFGDITAFSAKAEVQVLDDTQNEISSTPMDFSLLDKRIRVDIDQSLTKSRSMPPGAAQTLKQMGMARVVSILRPDKNMVYVFYPEQKAMMTMPLPNEDSESAKAQKTVKTPLGKETVDGHNCVKNRVVVTLGQGAPIEAITWNAVDLKDFPIQIQTKEKETTSFVRFKQVQLEKPDASMFEPPSGYTQYADAQSLMQGIMKKVMESTGKK